MSEQAVMVPADHLDTEEPKPVGEGGAVEGTAPANGCAKDAQASFVPTEEELLELVRYYTRDDLNTRWFVFITGQHEWRRGFTRVDEIARVIGDEEKVQQAIDHVEAEFKADQDPILWEVFQHGSEKQWNAVQEAHHESPSKVGFESMITVVLIPPNENDVLGWTKRVMLPYSGDPLFLKTKSECCDACRQWLETEWRGGKWYSWEVGESWGSPITSIRLLRPNRHLEEALPVNLTTAEALLNILREGQANYPRAVLTPSGIWREKPPEPSDIYQAKRVARRWEAEVRNLLERHQDCKALPLDCWRGEDGGWEWLKAV